MDQITSAIDSADHRRLERHSPGGGGGEVAYLTNGHYAVQMLSTGCGVSAWGSTTITRAVAIDPTLTDGFHFYLRDMADGYLWSAGYRPTCISPREYTFRAESGLAEVVRRDRDIETTLRVCVAPQHDLEVRILQIANRGRQARQIELTSYLEFVLGDRESDAAHPAFSKMFIETHWWAQAKAILARRRPRSSDEPERWGFHRLLTDDAVCKSAIEFETNRARFVGRGRTLAHPLALVAESGLTGDVGTVLDPIGCLRVSLSIEPGESRSVAYLLGAADSRSAIDQLAIAVDNLPEATSVVDQFTVVHLGGNGHAESNIDRQVVESEANRLVAHLPHGLPGPQSTLHETAGVYEPVQPGLHRPGQAALRDGESLQFDNGLGGFSANGREYVIHLRGEARGDLRLPPQPWTNVIANERAGFLVTERGGGYSWVGNSRHNRLTPWANDPVCDPVGEALWVRDEQARQFWSPLPGPTPGAGDYQVRHGFGYSTFRHESSHLFQETTMFMAADEPLKVTRLRLVNRGRTRRRLSIFSYLRWVLGTCPSQAAAIETEHRRSLQAILARNPQREPNPHHVAFCALTFGGLAADVDVSHTADSRKFIGPHGHIATPAAIVGGETLDKLSGRYPSPCAAWQLSFELEPDESMECAILLGESSGVDDAARLIRSHHEPKQIENALRTAQSKWHDLVSTVEVETPAKELDILANGWLVYQNLSCRMWARSAYYQSGGAFGFRDQLQDAAAMVYHRPDLTRKQILRNASQQFPAGDVFHWWHPDTGHGLRTRFSDDLLWLPLVTAEYVSTTGDTELLDVQVPFVEARPLVPGEQEALLQGESTSATASLYEHCCRAMDRGLTSGPHGLPLIGCGDWNDGMNRVGRGGLGESVWLGFFAVYLIDRMLPICRRRGDDHRANRYGEYRQHVVDALNTAGWDGDWYRRAYFDDGTPLGTNDALECQIDALAQAWAVLSRAAPPSRAEQAINAVGQRLVDHEAGLIRLLAPSFDRGPGDPGYIKGYLPGIRENGGQYTHGVLWFVRALAEMGRGTQAIELLQMLSPISHTSRPKDLAVYQTEPYVVAADVYGEPPHIGRGGWTWYTGSAGWMLRVILESVLGLSLDEGRTLVLNPVIAAAWPRCRFTYRLPTGGTRYEVVIENPSGKQCGVTAATLDGASAEVVDGTARIPLCHDGQCHRVIVHF